jgi:hypothetical protein
MKLNSCSQRRILLMASTKWQALQERYVDSTKHRRTAYNPGWKIPALKYTHYPPAKTKDSSSVALQSLKGLGCLTHTGPFLILLFRYLVGLLWTSDQPVAKASYLQRTTQHRAMWTNILSWEGIRTHGLKVQTNKGLRLKINRAATGSGYKMTYM